MTDAPRPTDQEILDRLAGWVVDRRLTAPAIFLLESHRPVSFLGSQALIAASPIVHFFESALQTFFGPEYAHAAYRRFAELLEDRDTVERLIVAIERRNQERQTKEREEKALRKAERKAERERRRAAGGGGFLGLLRRGA